jgi:hypothetical protein
MGSIDDLFSAHFSVYGRATFSTADLIRREIRQVVHEAEPVRLFKQLDQGCPGAIWPMRLSRPWLSHWRRLRLHFRRGHSRSWYGSFPRLTADEYHCEVRHITPSAFRGEARAVVLLALNREHSCDQRYQTTKLSDNQSAFVWNATELVAGVFAGLVVIWAVIRHGSRSS